MIACVEQIVRCSEPPTRELIEQARAKQLAAVQELRRKLAQHRSFPVTAKVA